MLAHLVDREAVHLSDHRPSVSIMIDPSTIISWIFSSTMLDPVDPLVDRLADVSAVDRVRSGFAGPVVRLAEDVGEAC